MYLFDGFFGFMSLIFCEVCILFSGLSLLIAEGLFAICAFFSYAQSLWPIVASVVLTYCLECISLNDVHDDMLT